MGEIHVTVDVTVDGERYVEPVTRTVDMDGATPWMWAMARAADVVRLSRDQWTARLDMGGSE